MATETKRKQAQTQLSLDKSLNLRYSAVVFRIVSIVLLCLLSSHSYAESKERPARPYADCIHQLNTGHGLQVRNPKRAYGKKKTVDYLIQAGKAVQAAHPKSHNALVGDLSFRGGGRMKPHLSHRKGLDADIGYYYRDGRFRKWFAKTSANQLDAKRQWTFIDALLKTNDVQYIFMSYRLQRRLYKEAERQGVSKKRLKKIFQWPRRWTHRVGIIRFERGHDTHIHVRFFASKKQQP